MEELKGLVDKTSSLATTMQKMLLDLPSQTRDLHHHQLRLSSQRHRTLQAKARTINFRSQQRRDAEVEDEKAEEQARLVEEFEVMEGLEERVKRLKEKREALRLNARAVEDDGGEVEVGAEEKPHDPSEEEDDDSDEIDEWGLV